MFAVAILFLSNSFFAAMPVSAAEATEIIDTTEPFGYTWAEIAEIEYDSQGTTERVGQLEKIAAAAENGNASGQEQELIELYRQLVLDIEQLDTCYSVSHILYFCDVDNEELSARDEQIYKEYVDLSDRMWDAMSTLMDSPYRETLDTVMSLEEQEEFIDYQKMTEREKELVELESALVKEYEQASQEEFSAVIDGEEWTYDNMYDADAEVFFEVYQELGRVKNEALSGYYLDLMELRAEMAGIYDYDNYLEFALEEVYEKDYTTEDMRGLFADIKEYLVPVYYEMIGLVYTLDWDVLDQIDSDPEVIMDLLEPYMADIDPSVYDTFVGMREAGLYNSGADSKKGDGGFTAGLPLYDSAFIFINPSGDYQDYGTMIHEFGHFYNACSDRRPAILEASSLDITEIHSNGLQMLFGEYSQAMFGAEIGETYNLTQLMTMLESGILYQAMISEFEMEVYLNPAMSVAEMNSLYARLEQEYGMGLAIYGMIDEESYGWAEIPHIYQDPLYCISYVTSGLSSLDLFGLAQEDREQAIEVYLDLIELPAAIGYREAIEACGFNDVFTDGALEAIAANLSAYMSAAGGGSTIDDFLDSIEADEPGYADDYADGYDSYDQTPAEQTVWEEFRSAASTLMPSIVTTWIVLTIAEALIGIIILIVHLSRRSKRKQ